MTATRPAVGAAELPTTDPHERRHLHVTAAEAPTAQHRDRERNRERGHSAGRRLRRTAVGPGAGGEKRRGQQRIDEPVRDHHATEVGQCQRTEGRTEARRERRLHRLAAAQEQHAADQRGDREQAGPFGEAAAVARERPRAIGRHAGAPPTPAINSSSSAVVPGEGRAPGSSSSACSAAVRFL